MRAIPACDSASTLAISGGANQIAAMPDRLRIAEDDLTGAQIVALLELHLAEMHRWSPPESVHAMPVARLRQPDVTFYAAWAETNDGARLAGCGALKHLSADHGELKSMRAHPDYRGRGVGKAILDHLLAEARARGYARVSLETGRPAAFAPARGLYASHGFEECPPFADYVADDFSVCMTKVL
jgi:putative acetyltransferase